MPADRILIKKEIAAYAQTLLESAKDKDAVLELRDQFDTVVRTVRGNIDLRNALSDTTIDAADRVRILKEVFKGFDERLLSVLGIAVEREESGLISRIFDEYVRQAEESLGVVVVDVVTVVELDDPLRAKIKEKLAADLGKEVVLRERIDPSIIGGIIMSAHGISLDASILSQLENTRRVLSTVPNGGER